MKIIQKQIYDNGCINDKFIPILPPDGSHKHILEVLSDYTAYKVYDDYDRLLKRLKGENRHMPPLGKKEIKTMFTGLIDPILWTEAKWLGMSFVIDRRLSEMPIVRFVFDNKRNLTDRQLKLIAEKGGIVGLNFFSAFLGGDTFEKIYENIYHLLEMGLENHIAIGSDFDGADMDSRLRSTADIPELYFKLSEKGISDRVLNKFFYENAFNYMGNL